jgi:hypothetical protein
MESTAGSIVRSDKMFMPQHTISCGRLTVNAVPVSLCQRGIGDRKIYGAETLA